MTIPIAFICDEGYALPTGVAITSIRCHLPNRTDIDYDIYVYGVGLAESSKEKLRSLSADSFRVTVVECELTKKQKQVQQIRSRVTVPAILKFDLPLRLSQYDKILYLDSDLIVRGSLVELFEIDLGEAYAGVVKDTMTFANNNNHLDFLEFKESFYFNSGVLLLNARKMREDDLPAKLLDYRINGKNFFMDQDAFNVVFGHNVCYLPVRYNLLTCFLDWFSPETLSDFYETPFPARVEAAIFSGTILHFGDKHKPWKTDMGYLTELYSVYYCLSPFSDKPLPSLKERGQHLQSRCLDLENQNLNLKKTIYELETTIHDLQSSVSYKTGRAITLIPRKLRDKLKGSC